jgi:NAD(P)-dependent dehydrogenase (short-subunit alcohol dehydrogenase family)
MTPNLPLAGAMLPGAELRLVAGCLIAILLASICMEKPAIFSYRPLICKLTVAAHSLALSEGLRLHQIMSEKIAIITGSSSGIGMLTAVELARAGFRVIATMRDLNRASRLDQLSAAAGVSDRIEQRKLDITETVAIPLIIRDILRDHGRIDVLINNAGFPMAGFAEDMRLDEIRQQFETNFFAQIAMTHAVLPAMRAQRSGHIIMVSSVSGRVGQPVLSSYCASKFALEGWSESLRVETHSLGIRVVLVEPGAFKTDIWDRNVRIGQVAISKESPNRERADRFAQFVKKAPKRDAIHVARLMARIAQDPNPKLRYMIGLDAHVQNWLRTLVPWRRYERMVSKAVKID